MFNEKEQNEILKMRANERLLESAFYYLKDILADDYDIENVEMFENLEGNKVIKYSHYDSTYLISIEELESVVNE